MAAQVKWHLSGDYFENCNCDVVCPCLISPAAPLTSRPTQGDCRAAQGLAPDNIVNKAVLERPGFQAKLARFAENRTKNQLAPA